jgi:hypothetical protein
MLILRTPKRQLGLRTKPSLSAVVATLGASLAVMPAAAEENTPGNMTCRGKLVVQEGSGSQNIKIGICIFTIDQYTGLVITDKCKIDERCTVQARVVKDHRGVWIDHVYSARAGK